MLVGHSWLSTTSLLPLRTTSVPLAPLLKSAVGAGVGVAMCVSKQLQ